MIDHRALFRPAVKWSGKVEHWKRIPDMVRPGVTGLLAPPRDVEALRAAIAELLQNPDRRAEMSANCRRVAAGEYALEVQARRYVEIYEAMIDGR